MVHPAIRRHELLHRFRKRLVDRFILSYLFRRYHNSSSENWARDSKEIIHDMVKTSCKPDAVTPKQSRPGEVGSCQASVLRGLVFGGVSGILAVDDSLHVVASVGLE